jgi:hypothetical protein
MNGAALCAGTSGRTSADPPDEVAEKIKQEMEGGIRAKRDRFEALFAAWLTHRAEYIRPDTDWTLQTEKSHEERETELARTIIMTPAVFPWMIFRKIEVLEHYLGGTNSTGTSRDNRELVMLAGIKADLLRFEPCEKESS